MNNASRTIVVVIVVIILVWVAYFIGQSSNNQPQSVATPTSGNTQSVAQPPSTVQNQQESQTPAPTPQPSYYTPMTFSPAVEAQRSSFVNSCASTGDTWGKCNC